MTLNPGSLLSVDLVGSQHFSLKKKKEEENGSHKLKLVLSLEETKTEQTAVIKIRKDNRNSGTLSYSENAR